jgi:murein DD-endopeptidase MepM/ murein hydrolase activator NlpD
MALVHEYKQLEGSLIQRIGNSLFAAGHGIVKTLQSTGHFLTRRYTVVFVPHSEKKVYNLQVNVLSIFLFLLVTLGIIGSFAWASVSYGSAQAVLASKDNRLKDAQMSLDLLRDEFTALLPEARGFVNAFSEALSALGSDLKPQNSSSGDLGSFFKVRETPEGLLQEVDNIRRLSAWLISATPQVKNIGDRINFERELLAEIPSISPVKGVGHISMYFGQNVNPFSGQHYIHKGIDISTYRSGDPVLTTADGQIVTIDYTEDFGNYVLIKHKHGYYTRYAHLLSARVRLGQRVQQGEVIGYIGNTGLSTGPHLHYEIRIGSDVVDPLRYINMRSGIVMQGR